MELREYQKDFIRAVHRFGKVHMDHLFEGITRNEFFAMAALERYAEHHDGEGVKASELAQMVEASPQALSRTLRTPETKGYIERQVDSRDRRNTRIGLTTAAWDVIGAGKIRLDDTFRIVVEQMGEEELVQLIRLLNRLVDTMRYAFGQEEPEETSDEECCYQKD